MTKIKADLKGTLRKRTMQGMFGRVNEDYVCCLCLAIVPDPDKGCQHCQRKQEKSRAALQLFLERRRHE